MKVAQTISLIDLGQSLINHEKITTRELKAPLVLNSHHVPILKGKLPDKLSIFKFYRDKNNLIGYITLGVYQDNKPVVVVPNQNADKTEDFTIESFKIENGICTATIIHLETSLIVPVLLSDAGKLFSIDNPNLEIPFEDFDPSYLKDIPNLEVPLRNLEIEKIYKIVGIGKTSKQYKTPLIDLEDENGTIIKNVICNSFLSLFSANTDNSRKFSISEIKEIKRKMNTGKKKRNGEAIYEYKSFSKAIINPVVEQEENLLNL